VGTARTSLFSGVVTALALVPLTSAGAEFRFGSDASYFCVVESAGGISFNETTKKWESTRFHPDGKFGVRLKFIKTRVQKDVFEDETVHDYNVTITPSGQKTPWECVASSNADPKIVMIEEDALLDCQALYIYRFNLKTNRFIRAYLVGYIDGDDNKSDMPGVEGGTCTKID
jgi:hypothetical protein